MSQNLSAETILKMARNFQEARILLSGAELDIFSLLDSNPMTAEQVTEKINGNLRGMSALLDALVAIGFLEKRNEKYLTESSASKLLSSKAPNSVLPMVKHSARLWWTWSRLTDLAGNIDKSSPREDTKFDMEDMHAFIGAMHVVGSRFAPKVVEAVNPSGAKNLIDIGGGSGTYSIAFLTAVPGMKATLFDLPPVIEWARERFEQSGLVGRVKLVPGDFYKDELPTGHDLAFISAIIHQNSPEQNISLYEKAFRSLNSGGRVVIRDYVMSEDRTSPADGALFAINMLVGTQGGGTYTFNEIKQGLSQAGFTDIKQLGGESMFSLVEGYKMGQGKKC